MWRRRLISLGPSELLPYARNLENFELPEHLGPEKHSEILDEKLGFDTYSIENDLRLENSDYLEISDRNYKFNYYEGSQAWIGLTPAKLMTPYSELLEMVRLIESLDQVRSFVDLGAAYGRLGILLAAYDEEIDFTGYELVEQRVMEAKRVYESLQLDTENILCQNILSKNFKIPASDVYFIYDFSEVADLKIILRRLCKKTYHERFFLVARGKGVRSLISLRFPELWACHGAIHRKNWSLFSSYKDLV